MNISHIKYIAEIEKTGSITKAAANLFMGQPNLSKAVRELENELGIKIFRRTTKGVEPTAEGREFIERAKSVLLQFNELEGIYKSSGMAQKRLSVTGVFGGYISEAIGRFALLANDCSIRFTESDLNNTLKSVSEGSSDIGIVRYPAHTNDLDGYPAEIDEMGLSCESVGIFSPHVLLNGENHLAQSEAVSVDSLSGFTEIASLSWDGGTQAGISFSRQIITMSGGQELFLLKNMKNGFCVSPPVSESLLEGSGVVCRSISEPKNSFCDLLVYRRDISDEQRAFCDILKTNCC